MKKKSTSQSAFLNLRVLLGLCVLLAGVFLALFATANPSGVGPDHATGLPQNQGVTTRQELAGLYEALAPANFVPPACVAGAEMFNDVPASNPFCAWIEELARSGITGGCGGGNYCPGDPVTRAQMAAFLVKTLDFPNKGNDNTAIGEDALFSNTTGTDNGAFGFGALFSNTSGGFNNAFGAFALENNKTGFQNSAFGWRALDNNISGNNNTAVGGGALISNQSGADNTAVGVSALLENKGSFNTAVGFIALSHATTGSFNTAVGHSALASGPFGATVSDNTAVGAFAMENSNTAHTSVAVGMSALHNSNGLQNVGVGSTALANNNLGGANTAVGGAALNSNSGGSSNTALGFRAGFNATIGDGNVYIGRGMEGVAGEANHTYIRNLNTDTVTGGGTDFLNVDLATGRVGHNSSSRRYKEDIKPMDNASEALYRLKPVTYHYKKEIDRTQNLEYGLVAEDVAEVNPNLAIRDGKGQIESVRYTAVNAMLLNEFLKEHKKVEELEATVAQQQKGMDVLTAQLREQAAQIQKVSAEVQMGKSAAKVALNNH